MGAATETINLRKVYGEGETEVRALDGVDLTEHPELEVLSSAELQDTIGKRIDQQVALFNGMVVIAVLVSLLDESLLITIAGALAGIGFGTLIAWWWVGGLDSLLPGVAFRFPVTTAASVAVAAVVLGVVAAILPARRAARLKVVEALNYE